MDPTLVVALDLVPTFLVILAAWIHFDRRLTRLEADMGWVKRALGKAGMNGEPESA